MQSLLTLNEADVHRSLPSSLRQRMDQPMGDRPAATVVRRAPPTTTANVAVKTSHPIKQKSTLIPTPQGAIPFSSSSSITSSHTNPVARIQTPETTSSPVLSVVGNIVERKQKDRRLRGHLRRRLLQTEPANQCNINATDNNNNNTMQPSRFARERQLQAPAAEGFPSVRQPLGTFTKKSISRSPPTDPLSSAAASHSPETRTTAEEMLAQMSPEQVRESIQELQQALSPETIAFLRKRGQAKQQQQQHRQENPHVASHRAALSSPPLASERPTTAAVIQNDPAEKERLATILSSIRTYQDLDAAYAAEMGTTEEEDEEEDGSTMRLDNTDHTNANPHTRLVQPCELLRSTAPRQKLWAVKQVAQYLQDDLAQGRWCRIDKASSSSYPTTPHWPLLLPVSLRCLLDTPASSSTVSSFFLYTYCLQALYALLQLRACSDHVIDCTGKELTTNAAYQLYFLDDAVPTPSLRACYSCSSSNAITPLMNVGTDDENKNKTASGNHGDVSAVAYATLSSSTSAQADGEAFLRDPMWTLLSKMRIIPRLAQILRLNTKRFPPSSSVTGTFNTLPQEAIEAICGILAMVAQRSPGAASAIVQHPTLLRDLIGVVFPPDDSSPRCDAALGVPVVILLCTLARQSRVAAEGIDCDTLLLRVLASKAHDDNEFRLQQWSLILWRTLLRYGLCLSSLSSLLPIATTHTTLGSGRFSLAADFFAAFACVADCVKVAQMITTDESGKMGVTHEMLSQAGVWLSGALPREAIRHLEKCKSHDLPVDKLSRANLLRFLASCMKFLKSFLSMSNGNDRLSPGECKSEELSTSEDSKCVQALHSLVSSHAFKCVLEPCVHSLTGGERQGEFGDKGLDAAVFCYLDSIFRLTTTIYDYHNNRNNDFPIENGMEQLVECLWQDITKCLGATASDRTKFEPVEAAAKGWWTQFQADMVEFLAKTQTSALNLARPMAFSLMGRIDLGDESLAATIFSHDILFKPQSDRTKSPSPISTMFIRELCRHPNSRNQLDHSFKLHGGLGITSEGKGLFDLQSLLSEAENSSGQNISGEHLLPLGKYWLWQTLSGTVAPYHQRQQPQLSSNEIAASEEDSQEVVAILTASLQLLTELEGAPRSMPALRWYVECLDAGAKLYHLCNISLQAEEILGQEQILTLSEALLDTIFGASKDDIGPSFSTACFVHSSSKAISGDRDNGVDETTGRHLNAVLHGGQRDEIKALQDFAGDICDAFVEYGAQYAFVTKCVRLLLLPCFPASVRCLVLNRTNGLHHLLTLPDEETNISTLLKLYMVGGLPSVDESRKDAPGFLDDLSCLFCDNSPQRLDSGLVSLLAVTLLARSLAIELDSSGSGNVSSVVKRRIVQLNQEMKVRVLETAGAFLASDGRQDDLVKATLHPDPASVVSQDLIPEPFLESDFSAVCELLMKQR